MAYLNIDRMSASPDSVKVVDIHKMNGYSFIMLV